MTAPDPALPQAPPAWEPFLRDTLASPKSRDLAAFLRGEREEHTVYPPEGLEFSALALTPPERVSVVILGQDPYHGPNQAHGLSFSVRPGVRPPPSLANIYRELQSDVGARPVRHGFLKSWAEQGVLLLNAVLTMRAHEPNSHAAKGWEEITDAVLRAVNEREERVVFVLWGAYARKKKKLVTNPVHVVLESAHPSPLSATKFFGSRPFSAVNAALREAGRPEIDWPLPEKVEE